MARLFDEIQHSLLEATAKTISNMPRKLQKVMRSQEEGNLHSLPLIGEIFCEPKCMRGIDVHAHAHAMEVLAQQIPEVVLDESLRIVKQQKRTSLTQHHTCPTSFCAHLHRFSSFLLCSDIPHFSTNFNGFTVKSTVIRRD